MDNQKINNLRQIAEDQRKYAEKYFDARRKAGTAKVSIELLLTAALPEIRAKKKNVGIEMAMMMLMETSEEAKSFYKDWQIAEAEYKGLEKLLDAHASRISMEQSFMKFVLNGEKYGNE